ncbi:MAG: hypothetical protein AB7J28_00130 [Hyphomonadaceae bacterium]
MPAEGESVLETELSLTLLFARVFGVFFLVSAISQFATPSLMRDVLEDLRRHPAMLRVVGALTFFLGAFVTATHTHWTDPLAIAVTLVGWYYAIEGALLMALMPIILRSPDYETPNIAALKYAVLLAGALLTYAGFFGRALEGTQ